MNEVLFGTALLTAFLGGVVALFAPCCVSVMLPAYLATGVRSRSGVLVATVVFAAGIGTVIVPIGLGASALSGLVAGHHLLVYLIGGAAMGIGGVAVIAGWKPRLPMVAGWRPGGQGWAATYGLGVFSGLASSCCAPVLAGVVVLSGATASFPAALAVSLTYVAGMAAPLCALAMVWDGHSGAANRFLHSRTVRLRVARRSRTLPLGMLLSGLLLVAMGALTVGFAFAGPNMGSSGWQVRVSAWLQHNASVVTNDLTWLPGWVFAVLLASGVAAVGWRVGHLVRSTAPDRCGTEVAQPDACCPPGEAASTAPSATATHAGRKDPSR